MPDGVKVFFETDSISNASPGSIGVLSAMRESFSLPTQPPAMYLQEQLCWRANTAPSPLLPLLPGRVGLLHMPEDADHWKFVLGRWVKSISIPALEPLANKFDVMISAFCTPLFKFLSFPGRSVLKQVALKLVLDVYIRGPYACF